MEKVNGLTYQENQDQIINVENNQYAINKSEDITNQHSNKDYQSNKRKQKRKKEKLYFSSKHTAFLIAMWIVFIATFIIGFIVHFETTKNVTASSIIWTFSVIIFVFSALYSYCYYKCSKATTEIELQKYLKFIPC